MLQCRVLSTYREYQVGNVEWRHDLDGSGRQSRKGLASVKLTSNCIIEGSFTLTLGKADTTLANVRCGVALSGARHATDAVGAQKAEQPLSIALSRYAILSTVLGELIMTFGILASSQEYLAVLGGNFGDELQAALRAVPGGSAVPLRVSG